MNVRPVMRLLPYLAGCLASMSSFGADEFSFDIGAYQKKAYEFNGYIELLADRQYLNHSSTAYLLNFRDQPFRDTLDHQAVTVELIGSYKHDNWLASFNAHATAEQDQFSSSETSKFYEALLAYNPDPGLTVEAGKKALKWGKGYAWNPVAFAERPKDPDEPELSREGYVMATADIIKSYSGDLQTVAFTPVYLPVREDINSQYGRLDHNNFATKLYLLYRDTDIDLLYLSEGSRSYRYGFDIARNIETNFEIHAEWAYISEVNRPIVSSGGAIRSEKISAQQWLVGVRYLTENETTIIAEYYHNQAGYTEDQLRDFYQAVADADASDNTVLLGQLASVASQTYLRRNPGQRYFYLRLSNKEPFDLLYFTPAVTLITNLDDNSYSISPEFNYTGFANLELRFKASWLQGDKLTEFGEKRNDSKFELRLRYYY